MVLIENPRKFPRRYILGAGGTLGLIAGMGVVAAAAERIDAFNEAQTEGKLKTGKDRSIGIEPTLVYTGKVFVKREGKKYSYEFPIPLNIRTSPHIPENEDNIIPWNKIVINDRSLSDIDNFEIERPEIVLGHNADGGQNGHWIILKNARVVPNFLSGLKTVIVGPTTLYIFRGNTTYPHIQLDGEGKFEPIENAQGELGRVTFPEPSTFSSQSSSK